MERYQTNKNDLRLVFIDLEKAYNRVSREIFGKPRRRKRLELLILKLIKICIRGL